MKKVKNKDMDAADNLASEPAADYGKVIITTLEALENETRYHTVNMSYEERMEYLQKLRDITHGNDLSEEENAFYIDKIRVNKIDENI